MASFLKSCICCCKCCNNEYTNLTETDTTAIDEVSDNQIEKLAESIVVTKMETIAISYLKIQSETVANLKISHQGNPTAFNRSLLTIWKCMNPGMDQVQNLASILYKAASDGGYLDPHKVEDILGAPSSCAAEYKVSEAEFLSIAKQLKPFTKQKMKIEPFPWFEGYLINMDELYTELTLEKVERKLLGEKRKKLKRYAEMFGSSESKNRKVLMKADPGMGKTTLGRKMSWDWARGHFKKFSMIFFVALKLVKSGDPIEKVIMQQHPELESLGVSQQKLKAILNRFRNRILIILDGLDEQNEGQNEDVLKIVKNQKLLDCGIIVSSRPHSSYIVEKHFPTIVRVEGFTETEARKFVSNFFTDRTIIRQILQFKPSDSREDFPLHKCPILLSFLCLLVKDEGIDFLNKNLTIGDLYLRMVQCLYKKFTIRNGMTFNQGEFEQVLKSVGQLALQTLKANYPLLQKSEVKRIVGDHAFEYGFFAGHEDFRLCTDPTADICVTFAHRSLEEFFWSFGFLQELDDGKSMGEVLGSDCDKPIFMVNPLVMKFCLWLQTKFFSSQRITYDKLVTCGAQQIDTHVLDIDIVDEIFPAMGIRKAVHDRDRLKLEFFKQVFEKCEQVRVFQIRRDCTYEGHQVFATDVLGILGLISHSLLSKLSLVSITQGSNPRVELPDVNTNALTVSIDILEHVAYKLISKIHVWLKECGVLKRTPQVYSRISSWYSQDLLVQKHVKELHLVSKSLFDSGSRALLSKSGDFPFCPHFTHFTANYFHIDHSVPAAFMRAVKEGKLPNLRRIELNSCTMNDCEWPEVPEFSCDLRGMTMSDPSQMQKLLLKLTELTVWEIREPLHIDRLIPVRLEKLLVLKLEFTQAAKLQSLNDVLKQGFLPNVANLLVRHHQLEGGRLDTFLHEFDPNHFVKLEKFALQRFTISAEELDILSQKLTDIQLTELDLSHSSGFTGSLSVLFTHSLPTLNTLKLMAYQLNTNDLQSLARGNVEGKLPLLRHLDILGDNSYNKGHKISDLFAHSTQWNQLKTLGTADRNILNVEPEFLSSLEELCVSWPKDTELPCITRCWSGLKTIVLYHDTEIPYIADGVERGMFPTLTTVRFWGNYDSIDKLSLFKLFKANIAVI